VGTTGPSFDGLAQIPSMMQRNMGNGAAVGDYDGDGDHDIYLLGYEGYENVLYRNDMDGGFVDVTAEAGVADSGLSRVAHFVDLNNDGHLDLILANDTNGQPIHGTSRLWRNDGDGTFTDVTTGSHFEALGYLRCGMALADYDGDGLLDVYVTAWTFEIGTGSPLFPGSNRLYRNLGDFRFEDVTDDIGLGGLARDSFTPIFADFDGDFRSDIFVAVDHTSDEFYWNRVEGFVRATEEVGTIHVGNDMGVACADFDDDGDLDTYATNIAHPAYGTTDYNCLNVNQKTETGVTTFVDGTVAHGLEYTYWGWGVDWVDVENDGDLDVIAVTGFDEFIEYRGAWTIGEEHPLFRTPSVLHVNDGEQQFTAEEPPGLDHEDDSRGLVIFDFDRDGDQDALITNVRGPARLLENVTPNTGHWLDVEVRQARGRNKFGIGVALYATIDGVTKRRDILAGESYLVGTPAEAHFGLGEATVVDELRVVWTDGTETLLTDVPADQLIRIVQPLPGDVDGDDDVDSADLLELLAAWGDCPDPPDPCPADFDGDGTVTTADLVILIANWS
jgi:hypothetical protein